MTSLFSFDKKRTQNTLDLWVTVQKFWGSLGEDRSKLKRGYFNNPFIRFLKEPYIAYLRIWEFPPRAQIICTILIALKIYE